MMKKQRVFQAWKMLVASLPKAIPTFVIAVAGISAGLPLAVFVIGLPILAGTLVWCDKAMRSERRLAEAWRSGSETADEGADEAAGVRGWRRWVAIIGRPRMYRGLVFAIAQFPIAIAAFTLAITLPVTSIAVLLSPAAQYVSMEMFAFDLFASDWAPMERLIGHWTSFDRAWLSAGVGAVMLLLTIWMLKAMGRMYAGWLAWIAGPEPRRAEPSPLPEAELGMPYPVAEPVR